MKKSVKEVNVLDFTTAIWVGSAYYGNHKFLHGDYDMYLIPFTAHMMYVPINREQKPVINKQIIDVEFNIGDE